MLLVTGCIKPSEAYQSIEWNILILIYGMLALGLTMQSTGVSAMIASVVGQVGMNFFDPSWHHFAVLVMLYLITAVLTELLSNNATIVIMAPIALALAYEMLGPTTEGQDLARLCLNGVYLQLRQFCNTYRLSNQYFRLHGRRL